MSETDVQMNQLDFSELESDVNQINDSIKALTYAIYYLSGATTVILALFVKKLLKNLYCKKSEVIQISEESISLLSNIEKRINDLDSKVAIAIKIEKQESEKSDHDPLTPNTNTI